MSSDLQLEIINVLRATPGLTAIEIVNELALKNILVTRDVVNKALYYGPFESSLTPGRAAPAWRAYAAIPMPGRFYFEIEGVAQLSLSESKDGSEKNIRSLLKMFSELSHEGDSKTLRYDNTAGGKMVAALAPEFGFTAVLKF